MSLVEVYATVVDDQGALVPGLTVDDFVVEEDGQRQVISDFAAGEFPLALAVAVDWSFSIPRSQLSATALSVGRFLRQLRPDDLVTLLAVGSQVDVVSPLAADREGAIAALSSLEPWGSTSLYDATVAALDAIQSAKGRRALILISDGEDRYSETTSSQVLEAVRARDVLVYPVALGGKRRGLFAELASISGGRSFNVGGVRDLAPTLSSIGRELRAHYLLGYAPAMTEGRPGWRSIRVSVKRSHAIVRARDGYRVAS